MYARTCCGTGQEACPLDVDAGSCMVAGEEVTCGEQWTESSSSAWGVRARGGLAIHGEGGGACGMGPTAASTGLATAGVRQAGT